jgi:hypothetical protein
MEELLVIILQFLFEFIINAVSSIPFDWPSRNRTTPEADNSFAQSLVWFCGGCLLAGVSLLVFKQSIISVPALRIANLILAPIISAIISEAIASHRAESNIFIIPKNHFWHAFWFTLGLTLIRFAYAKHG